MSGAGSGGGAPGPAPRAVHLAIDMQRLFAEPTGWQVPGLAGILPNVLRLAETLPTLCPRFVVPASAGAAPGRWQAYYRRWAAMTGERLDPALLDLVPPLAALAAPDDILGKPGYSAFGNPRLASRLAAAGADTLVLTGVETDVCVLATALDAVDRGFHVILVTDAVASASEAAHASVLAHLMPRLAEQVTMATTEEIVALIVAFE